MAVFARRLFSIIFVGNHNPSILTHDFLSSHEVIPMAVEPFLSLSKSNQPFTNFMGSPLVSSISYGTVSLMVSENRFQIIDEQPGTDIRTSPILAITRKYFGTLLKYTPLTLGGMNIGGDVDFESAKGIDEFTENVLQVETVSRAVGSKDIRMGMDVTFPWQKGVFELRLSMPKDRALYKASVNFNYEFPFDSMDSFLAQLDLAPVLADKSREILSSLDVT